MPFVIKDSTVNAVKPAAGTLGASVTAGINLSPSVYHTYEEIYKTQPAVRTVIGFIARNIAELGVDVFKRGAGSDTDREKVRDHPLSVLLRRPFAGSKWTQYKLLHWTLHEICLYDSAFWLKSTIDGTPAVLPVPRRFMSTIGDNLFFPDKYRLTGTRGYRDFNPEDVVHFYGYNPDDPRNGLSPIETLRQILAEDYAAARFREQLWKNGARVGGYITRPPDVKAGKWSDTARERFKRDWQAYYTGEGLQSAGGTPILEDGMTYTPAGVTPKDAQYVEARMLTREEVATAFHLNPEMIGLRRDSRGSDTSDLRKQLYADSFGPWLRMMAEDLENQLLPDLDPAGVDNVYVEFNLRRKLQGSFEEQAAAVSASTGAPWMTRNEARSLFNLPDVPDGEELITPLNVVTGGLASPRDTAPDNPSNEESNGEIPGPKPLEVGA